MVIQNLTAVLPSLKPVVCIFKNNLLKVQKSNLRFFFRKLLAVCTVSIPEWVMMAFVQYRYVFNVHYRKIENSSLQVDHDFVLLQSSVITKNKGKMVK